MLNKAAEDHTFIKRIITDEKTWVFKYNVEVVLSSEWRFKNVLKTKKPRKSRSINKSFFFDYRDVVHYEFVPLDQTVSNEYYLAI